jgi:hypothetical protein
MHLFRLSFAALAALALAATGCGGSDEAYYIPADHQIRPFAEPEEDELTGEEEEVLEDEEAAEPAEAPPAAEPAAAPEPAAAAAPAAAPEKKPGKSGKRGKAKAKPASAKSGSGSP